MVRSFTACEHSDVFPGNTGVHPHVVDVAANIAAPLRFGEENKILYVL
jgi:hypothetical protein